MNEDDDIRITMSFTLPDGTIVEKEFDPSNCQEIKLGAVALDSTNRFQPGTIAYTGHHDHGPLPPPKEGGPFAQLIGCVIEAKAFSDNYLTEVIQQEKTMSQGQDQHLQGNIKQKKAKLRH